MSTFPWGTTRRSQGSPLLLVLYDNIEGQLLPGRFGTMPAVMVCLPPHSFTVMLTTGTSRRLPCTQVIGRGPHGFASRGMIEGRARVTALGPSGSGRVWSCLWTLPKIRGQRKVWEVPVQWAWARQLVVLPLPGEGISHVVGPSCREVDSGPETSAFLWGARGWILRTSPPRWPRAVRRGRACPPLFVLLG